MTTRWPRRCGFALPSSSGCRRKQAKTYGKHTVNRNGTWRRERGHAFLRLAGGGGGGWVIILNQRPHRRGSIDTLYLLFT